MITEDLIIYIQAQRKKDVPETTIRSRLALAGWHIDDIDEAFQKLTPPVVNKPVSSIPITPTAPLTPSLPEKELEQRKTVDPYRELPTLDEPKAMEEKPWTPPVMQKETPKTGPVTYVIPQQPKKEVVEPVSTPIVKAIFAQSFNEANPSPIKIAPEIKPEVQPVSIPIARPMPIEPSTERQLELRAEELMPALMPKAPPVVSPLTPKEMPATPPLSQGFSSFTGTKLTPSMPVAEGKIVDSLPRGALLHSYQQVLSSAAQADLELQKKRKHKIIKWLVVVLIISIVGGTAFAVARDYIQIPFLTFSFIKKDPKNLLLNAPQMLGQLKSYKIETIAMLSMPSFGDITAGLVSGDAVSAHDQDSISLSAKGMIQNGLVPPTFDYVATLTSSLFKNAIVADMKYDNGTAFITTPDLREILGANAPPVTLVAVPKGRFDSFITLLPPNTQARIRKIDMDKVLSLGVPSKINPDTARILNDFVTSASVIEKEVQDIHGVPSYHYQLSADRQSTKELLTKFSHVFLANLSLEDQATLDDALGAAAMDSFEIWIGKDDGNIHQYKFNISIPLSKVLGLEDKGIAGNQVRLSLQTSYYDFDVPNTIILPSAALSIDDFLKDINDMKLKNSMASFSSAAATLHNALGKYGTRANPTGSCINPSPSSLFSPVGHAKGATVAVGTIASIMTDLVAKTNGSLSCYSTPLAWALSAPLSSDSLVSYCADSTSAATIINEPLTGTVCK